MTKKPAKPKDRIAQIERDASKTFKDAMLKAIGEQVDKLYPFEAPQVRKKLAAKAAAKHKRK